VALTTNPAGLGVDPAVEEALRRAGTALENAGYAVEEVDPPSVEATADLWWSLVWNEMRHLQAPVMRKLGDKKVIRTTEFYLASTPEVDLVGYMRDLASRATHLRAWLLFLERYPLILGPVSTELPFAADFDIDESADASAQKRAFRLMITVNLLGLPAVAAPTGLSNGVPVGVQVIGSRYREDLCLDETPIDATWSSSAS
jgi:amidase